MSHTTLKNETNRCSNSRDMYPFCRRILRYRFVCSIELYKDSDRAIPCNHLILKAKKHLNSDGLCLPLCLSIFGFLSDEATPEDKLITTIKRSILCIEREQYDKAEQMLHLALRMAQDLQSEEGITYVYDVMANLALERGQYKKSEKLYTDVIRRLMSKGLMESDPKILHISSKIAHMAELQENLDKASIGFEWTIKNIEESLSRAPEDDDLQELLGLTQNWYGQLLMKLDKYKEAKQCFSDAYKCYSKVHGVDNEECITILNNLSVACLNMEQFAEAKLHLEEALNLAKLVKDYKDEGVLLANLGLIYLREGFVDQAKSNCTTAWRNGTNTKSDAAIKQAEYCLDEIKSYGKKT